MKEKKQHDPIVKTEYCYCHDCIMKAQDYFLKYMDRWKEQQEKIKNDKV